MASVDVLDVGVMQFLCDSLGGKLSKLEAVHQQMGHSSHTVCFVPDIVIQFAIDYYHLMAGQGARHIYTASAQ